jgi:hypothetical protein
MRSSIHLDHLSTWNEVSDALAFSSFDQLELNSACTAARAIELEFSDGLAIVDEERAWLALASKVGDSRAD